MADVERLRTDVTSSEKDIVEQHVEEEIVHEIVSPEQPWELDADETASSTDVPAEDERQVVVVLDDGHDGDSRDDQHGVFFSR